MARDRVTPFARSPFPTQTRAKGSRRKCQNCRQAATVRGRSCTYGLAERWRVFERRRFKKRWGVSATLFPVAVLTGLVVAGEIRSVDGLIIFLLGLSLTRRSRTRSNEEHFLEAELRRQATTDALTGLPNRRMLPAALDALGEDLIDPDSGVAIILLDVKGFRSINDFLGAETGDQVLQFVASRLRNAVDGHLLLRLGSDEFAAVVSDQRTEADVLGVADKLRSVFLEPFHVAGRTEHLSVNVGAALVRDSREIADLYRRSEIALVSAKRSDSDGCVMYEPALDEAMARRVNIRRALYSADYDREFEVVYQPIVSADTAEIHGLEALLRWDSPLVGNIGPDEFIPIAEDAGDIHEIGKWVVEEVCRQVAAWSAAGMSSEVAISFNVSALQLVEGDFVEFLSGVVRAWGIDSGRLVVEVTETAALDEQGMALRQLAELKDAGFLISVDDFGSGYSNLGQLLRVPFDVLKIDRSLLLMLTEMRAESGGDASDPCELLQAVVSIARILDVPVVCEGVETDVQRRSLAASGVTYVQGYLTGRPASAVRTAELLELANWGTKPLIR